MSLFTLIENWEGRFKKNSFETVSYAKKIADKLNSQLTVLTFSAKQPSELSKFGADKIINISNIKFEEASNDLIAEICQNHIQDGDYQTLVFSNTNLGKNVSPIISQKLNYELLSNVISHPDSISPMSVKCKAYSSKAIVEYQSSSKLNAISIVPNSIGEIDESPVESELKEIEFNKSTYEPKLKVISRSESTEKISLPDANIVVSAGRGLKGPENWKMIEELANLLNAGTACSKPVSDMGWRPHSEHVGQTGIAINPELYIAIGISGAIQHLAGVNSSKNIVVINSDPEAPFFKSADYGIVGDAFDIIPKLIEEIKQYKN